MLVETHALTKQYGPLRALADCNFAVARGEVCGLLGPNGAGKTTLLRLLMGYLRPTAGQATIDGLDCYRQSVDVHRQVSYLPGEARLFRAMNGHQVLRYFAGIRPDGNFKRSQEIAACLGMDLSRQVARCSTGMRQILGLSIALSVEAPLVILDEPTASLDPTVRGQVLDLIAEAKDQGRTVLLSSHVLGEVERSCDRVVILRAGHVALEQKMDELLQQHRIRATLAGPLPEVPDALRDEATRFDTSNGQLVIETPAALSGMLSWLATLPVEEMRIEPVGLQSVYDRIYEGKK